MAQQALKLAAAALRRLDPRNLDLGKLDLRKLDLRKLDPRRIDLRKLDLRKIDLGKVDLLRWTERSLWAIGIFCLGLVAYAVVDAWWFTRVQERRLDRALAARAAAPPAGALQLPASATDRLDSFHPAIPVAPPPPPPRV
jgi:hypothetical protein